MSTCSIKIKFAFDILDEDSSYRKSILRIESFREMKIINWSLCGCDSIAAQSLLQDELIEMIELNGISDSKSNAPARSESP